MFVITSLFGLLADSDRLEVGTLGTLAVTIRHGQVRHVERVSTASVHVRRAHPAADAFPWQQNNSDMNNRDRNNNTSQCGIWFYYNSRSPRGSWPGCRTVLLQQQESTRLMTSTTIGSIISLVDENT